MNGLKKETRPKASSVVETFGCGPYKEYRIPGIVVLDSGTVMCCYEGRMESHNDWARIDIVVLRSTNKGRDFTRTVIASSDGLSQEENVTWNNPVLIADKELVHLIFHKNYETAYHCVSFDDGVTFSKPRDITQAFQEFDYPWNVCASGPGHGISLKSGRLLVPVWIANGEKLDESGRRKAHNPSTSGAVYSDDRGGTWHAGAMVSGITNANETSAAETADGTVLFNIRNGEPEKCRVLGISSDGGLNLKRVWKEESLPDPKCFSGTANLADGRIILVNCANRDLEHPAGKRLFLTVWTSVKGSGDWKTQIYVDFYGGYADVAAFGGEIYVFYEQCVWTEEFKRVNRLILKRYQM